MSVRKVDGARAVNALVKKTATAWCTHAVAVGDVVIIDALVDTVEDTTTSLATGGGELCITKAAATEDMPAAVGVALEAVSAEEETAGGKYIKFQVAGYNNGVTSDGVIANNALIGTDAGTAGAIQTLVAWDQTHAPFAICVKNYTGADKTGAIMIFDKGLFYAE